MGRSDYGPRAAQFGYKGFRLLNNATSVVGEEFIAIQIITDGNLTTVATRGDSLTALAVTAGSIVYGHVTSIIFTGVCLAYFN